MQTKQLVEPWFQDLILEGLQKLLCLGLERQPAAEMIPGTALAWEEALWPGRAWNEERDTPRIQQAFKNLVKQCRQWPVPAQFFDVFPRFEAKVLKLPSPKNDDVRKREMQRIQEILRGVAPGNGDAA